MPNEWIEIPRPSICLATHSQAAVADLILGKVIPLVLVHQIFKPIMRVEEVLSGISSKVSALYWSFRPQTSACFELISLWLSALIYFLFLFGPPLLLFFWTEQPDSRQPFWVEPDRRCA